MKNAVFGLFFRKQAENSFSSQKVYLPRFLKITSAENF